MSVSIKIWIFALFFFSGISALIYEVSWLRLLSLSFGSTAQATSCVLAVFLGGLAVGNWYGGKIADRLSEGELFTFYGKLEVGIAVAAPLVSWLVYETPALFALICHQFGESKALLVAIRILVSGAILLFPTILMGATSPALTRYVSLYGTPAKSFARLYAVNTLGAVIGSLAACFIGFAYWGLFGTIFGAAAINLSIGLCIFLLAGKLKSQSQSASEMAEKHEDSTETSFAQPSDLPFLCILSALVGFAALSYEVLWTRMLRFYSFSTTYSFTIMISSFLLGLGVGSLIFEQLYRSRKEYRQQLVDLGFAQYIATLACVGSLVAMPLAALVIRNPGLAGGQLHEVTSLIATGLIFIFPAATAVGLTFPMIGGMAACFKKVGTTVGAVYAANTLGCVAGALLVGLCVQPALGSFKAFQATVLFTSVIGSLAVLKGLWEKRLLAAILALIPPALALSFMCLFQDPIQQIMASSTYPKLLQYGEDSTGIVAVLDYIHFKELRTNSASVSTTKIQAKRYMRMLGVLPTLIDRKPKTVLVICFGTGTTAGAQSLCAGVEHMDIVELSPMVLKVGHQFVDSNLDVLNAQKVSAYANDGRNFLLCSKNKYDVITLEPPPLTEAGVVSLYSTEFYQVLKEHLNPGGIVCQWVPLFYESSTLWKMMVQSVRQTFPQVSVWVPNQEEAILLASESPLEIDAPKMQAKIDGSPKLKELLSEVGFDDVYSMLGTFVVAGPQLDKYVGAVRPITDDRPQMEFYLPYLGPQASSTDLELAAGSPLKCMRQSLKVIDADDGALKDNFERTHQIRTGVRQFWNSNQLRQR